MVEQRACIRVGAPVYRVALFVIKLGEMCCNLLYEWRSDTGSLSTEFGPGLLLHTVESDSRCLWMRSRGSIYVGAIAAVRHSWKNVAISYSARAMSPGIIRKRTCSRCPISRLVIATRWAASWLGGKKLKMRKLHREDDSRFISLIFLYLFIPFTAVNGPFTAPLIPLGSGSTLYLPSSDGSSYLTIMPVPRGRRRTALLSTLTEY